MRRQFLGRGAAWDFSSPAINCLSGYLSDPPLSQRRPSTEIAHLFGLIAGIAAVVALYFARAVLVPFALAMLLSFVLTPLVKQLQRLRLPRVPSVILVVFLAVAGAVFVGIVVTNQLIDVTTQLPTYRANIQKKLTFLHNKAGTGVLKATEAVSELGTEVVETLPGTTRPNPSRTGRSPAPLKPGEPVEVRVIQTPGSSLEVLLSLVEPLGIAGVVLVLTIFILLRLEDLRNRFIRLVGHNHITLMTQALDDASRRISTYLFLQFVVSAVYGTVIGLGLHLIGLPNALLWGVIASVFRFVPYVGSPLAAFLPIALSLAVFDGWTKSLMILGFYLVIEVVVGNFVEPMLYGAKTGISSLAILVAAVFWTLLWGPIGLVLSTPLTVCLVVVGRHVPQLGFLHVLLGDQPVLTPELRFYQRMLAADLGEARQVLEQYLQSSSLLELYDSVVIPALGMAQRDCQQNDLDEAAAETIYQNTREMLDELNEECLGPQKPDADSVPEEHEAAISCGGKIICIPSRTGADETVATMLVQLLEREGCQAACIPLRSQVEMIGHLAEAQPDMVVVSALQPFGLTHAKRSVAQVRNRLPNVNLVIGLWNFTGEVQGILTRLGSQVRGVVVPSLAAALRDLRQPNLDQPTNAELSPREHEAVASR
jgi:predicted PurR-regulated permease PerM